MCQDCDGVRRVAIGKAAIWGSGHICFSGTGSAGRWTIWTATRLRTSRRAARLPNRGRGRSTGRLDPVLPRERAPNAASDLSPWQIALPSCPGPGGRAARPWDSLEAPRRGQALSRGRVRLDLVARGLGLPAGPNRSLADCGSVLGCRRSLTRARAGPGLAARLALAPQHGGHVRAVLKSPLLLASQVPAGVLGAQSASCRVGSVVLVASPALAPASKDDGGPPTVQTVLLRDAGGVSSGSQLRLPRCCSVSQMSCPDPGASRSCPRAWRTALSWAADRRERKLTPISSPSTQATRARMFR